MPEGFTDEDGVLADLRERVASSPFHSGMGMSVASAIPGHVVLEMEARPEHLNLQELVHGGIVATLADSAMGLSVRSAIETGRSHVTVELGIHYLRPARPGRLVAEGHVLRVGSQLAFAEASVLDHEGRLLARATGTYSVYGERG